MSFNKFEEYKLFVEDTARFSERRQTVNNTYVTINSILLTAAAFLVKDAGFDRPGQAFSVILLSLTGLLICRLWRGVLDNYQKLVGFRINQLRIIETHPDLANCHRMYHAEDELYPRDGEGNTLAGKTMGFSKKEKSLPRVFALLYIGLAVFLMGFLAGSLRS